MERREWWLWTSAFVITLLLTGGLASFLVSGTGAESAETPIRPWFDAPPQAVRALIGLVFLFDLYTIYQQLLIHRIRRKLLEREELFQLINENATDMIAVVDMQGKRLFNSLSYSKVLGYSLEELKTSSSFSQIHPDDRERVEQAARNALRTGIGETLDYRLRHKNGAWLTLESSASVIRDDRGQAEKLLIVNRDITGRKRAEQALRRSEADFRSLIEDAPYGVYRANVAGRFLQVNAALRKMLAYTDEQELLGKDLARDIFRNPEEYQRFSALLSHTDEIKGIEMEWKRRDGQAITVRCSGQQINDDNHHPAYFEVFAEDVTEKRVLERQLRMAQKMEAIGRLSGGIAHDFNNLLGVIIGYSGALKKALGPGTAPYEYALEIEKAGQRAASLTKQLLAFSRQQVLTPAILDLNKLISDMQTMLPRLLGEDVAVSLHLEPFLGSVKADQSQIEQVIMNLAVNARDALPSAGSLNIRTANVEMDQTFTANHPGSRLGRYVLVAVTDTGTGMDAHTLAHLFEPFFTTKEVGKGTGLGLATVYGIVKQSDGYIWVDSAPGKGTSFSIYLPLYTGQQHGEERPIAPLEHPRSSETILLVEDAEPLRRLAQVFLEGVGFRVLSAASGEEALELAAHYSGDFDLLLTDVVMPGINGRLLAEHLLSRQPKMKVLYMSGYTDNVIAEHGVLDQGMHLLHKPFTEQVLVQNVRDLLDGRRQPAASKNTVIELR